MKTKEPKTEGMSSLHPVQRIQLSPVRAFVPAINACRWGRESTTGQLGDFFSPCKVPF